MTTNQIQRTREELARVLGEDPGNISQIQPQWLNFMRQGVVVDLHVGRWRGRSKLEYADLGLPTPKTSGAESALGSLLTLGRKNLLPARYLKRFDAIESGARKMLAENGTSTYWGTFVSAERYQGKVKAALEDFYSDYFATLREMIDNFPNVVNELMDEYCIQARIAFNNLSKINQELFADTMSYDEAEDRFINDFLNNITAMIPPASEIEASYAFDWELRFIPLPDMIEQGIGYDPSVQREYEALEHDRKMNEIVQGAERASIRKAQKAEEALRLEVLEKARKEKDEKVTAFMRDLVAQLRGMVYKASTDILSTLDKNQKLHPRSVVQIRNLVETIDQMNFFGDQDVDQMIARVRDEMAAIQVQPADQKSVEPMRATLEAIATITRDTLLNIGDTPRSGRSVGIPDLPAVGQVRAARATLGLDEGDIQPVVKRQNRQKVLVEEV